MDEADNLCDRIAIVDHGKLAVLDTPSRLKDSVPGTDTVEAEFDSPPADWQQQLGALSHAAGVKMQDGFFHISSNDGPATVAALMDLARKLETNVHLRKVTVQSTTLDDVFSCIIHRAASSGRPRAAARISMLDICIARTGLTLGPVGVKRPRNSYR